MQNDSSLVALRHRNFRLLWVGQIISRAGTQMQFAAVLWHVSLLAPEGFKEIGLGLVGLVRVVPLVALSLVSGVVADALPRRRLMLATQTCMALVTGVLAALTLSGRVTLAAVYALMALSAVFESFDRPARNALIPNLVPREHLPNAISLNTIGWQAAAVLGPSLAGLVIATLGVGQAYLINALSFLAVIAGVAMMRGVVDNPGGSGTGVSLKAARDGLRFVFAEPLIRSTMLLDFFATFFSSAMALLPLFAQDVLNVGAQGYGLLAAAPSIGAVLMSVLLVRTSGRIERRGWVLLWAVAVYGLATVVFGLSRMMWLTFACLALTGAADTVSVVLREIIRQETTPDHLRGRMTSVDMVFFVSGPQLGEMEAGLAASLIGAPLAVVTGGLGCIVATLWLAAQTPALRHYRRSTAGLAASQVGAGL